jgi:hypothetical protein
MNFVKKDYYISLSTLSQAAVLMYVYKIIFRIRECAELHKVAQISRVERSMIKRTFHSEKMIFMI